MYIGKWERRHHIAQLTHPYKIIIIQMLGMVIKKVSARFGQQVNRGQGREQINRGQSREQGREQVNRGKKEEEEIDFLYGVNPIEVALAAKKRQFYSLILSDSESINTSSKVIRIINEAKILGIPMMFSAKEKMNRIVGNQPHQNIILKCSPIDFLSNREASHYAGGIHVYCDKITDPQNFGAIIRSCLYFGVKSVLVPRKGACPLNSTVSKTSSGASELLEIHRVSKDQQFLNEWKQSGGIIISTSVSTQTSTPLSLYQLPTAVNQGKKLMLLFGSEGYGVSPHLSRCSDYSLTIPRAGSSSYPRSLVDSLNVNAAVCCILSHLTKPSQ